MASQRLLTRTLVELADNLVEDFDVVDLLTLLTDRCVEAFDVTAAGLVMAAPIGGHLRVMASSSTTMRDVEIYELQASEGPCLDCYHTGKAILNQDLDSTTDRWPSFTPVATAAGFHSVSALPMRLRGTTIGALNLFRDNATGIPDDDLSAAQAFADVATIAILQHRGTLDTQQVNEQLAHALNSRVVIEQAKGMLAERAGLDVNQAFDWLRHHARNHNIKLSDLARDFLGGTVAVQVIEGSQPGARSRKSKSPTG